MRDTNMCMLFCQLHLECRIKQKDDDDRWNSRLETTEDKTSKNKQIKRCTDTSRMSLEHANCMDITDKACLGASRRAYQTWKHPVLIYCNHQGIWLGPGLHQTCPDKTNCISDWPLLYAIIDNLTRLYPGPIPPIPKVIQLHSTGTVNLRSFCLCLKFWQLWLCGECT